MMFSKHKGNDLIDAVFGPDDAFPIEHQCFNGICFILAFLLIISTGVNYLIGLNAALVFGAFFLGLIFCLFFYLTRHRGLFFPLYWIVLFFGVLFVNLVYFYSGGISGTATIISLNIIAVVCLILHGWQRLVSILMICINLGVLFMIEYGRPGLVTPYGNPGSRFIDVFFTFSIAVLIISYVIYFTLRHFRLEREKVSDREGKLKAIIDNIPDSVWLKDEKSRFTMVNKPFSDNCGVPINQIIGNTVFDVWPWDKADRFEQDDNEVLSTGRTLLREESLTGLKSGEKRFEIIKTPIVDRAGKTTGIVGIARDITARHEYEDRLKKYKRIVDTSNDQMALINRGYRYEAANESYLKAHGLDEQGLVGKTVAEVHDTTLFEKTIAPNLVQAFKGRVINYQDEIKHPNAAWRYEEVSYFPYKNNNGKTISVVAHIKDITDKKQMARRLSRSERMEAIGTLAGGIAHDFNNILSGILGYAQLGKINLDDPGKLNRHLDQIITGSQRAGELIRQILTFSRKYDYEKQPLQTAPIIKEVLKLIRATIPTYIEMDEDITSEAFLLADPSQMHQIVMNLCTNAYQSISDTRGKLTITVKDVSVSAGEALKHQDALPGSYQCLRVADTGCGIEPEIIEKIFEPYFTTKELDKGTGLGLALVHGIVEELEGFIRVDSTPGRGSVFSVYLPVMDSDAADDLPEKQNLKSELSKGSGHIMVVDDETSILFSMQELLEDCGYRISSHVNGEQAFKAFVKDPLQYDLIITDMTMPVMTGDVLAQKMLEMRPDLPIILCTGFSDLMSEKRAAEIGITKFLEKPLVSTDLTVLIKDILNGRQVK